MRFNVLFTLIIIMVFNVISHSQTQSNSHYFRNFLGLTSSGAMKFGLYGSDNPALLSTLHAHDFYFTWTTQNGNWNEQRQYYGYAAFPNFSFNFGERKQSGYSVEDYQLAVGFGDGRTAIGFSYGWSRGDKNYFRHSDFWSVGTFYRPMEYFHIGLTGNMYRNSENEAVFDIAFRPFGNEQISLFADYVARKNRLSAEPAWSAGVAVEAFPGVCFTARYFEEKNITAGLRLELGEVGLTTQSYFDADNKHQFNSYGIRLNAYDRNIFSKLFGGEKYYSINLINGVKYRRFKFFDQGTTLTGIINDFNGVIKDPTIKGVVINASGFSIGREMGWEIREKMKELREAGKKIIVYFDRMTINEYHLFSVADKIVVDPIGTLAMEGFLLGRNYLKGTLEKVGIGYDELRFFKYKSAAETFSREKMSDADREQRQALVDDFYETAKFDIVSSGRITAEQFDTIINNEFILLPQRLLELKLVDEIARWTDLTGNLESSGISFIGSDDIESNKLPLDGTWGKKPQIAVIYALGECAMDMGINARSLVNYVNDAVNSDDIKAIVLRVDSPGGDALASDYISEALLKAKGKKPVIVSQGSVAASGGYWLSMYADTIVAGPTTITGSIGVISGWFYDNGFKEKIGVTTDHVKRGDHADLGYGFMIPLINFPVPDRKLSVDERAMLEKIMKTLYGDFVQKVSNGRKKSYDYIATIAEGRVWSGKDGLANGLVDVLGGLETAIDIAVEKAGLSDNEFSIIEMPEPGMFDISSFLPRFITSVVTKDPVLKHLAFRLQMNGKPLFMLPMEEIEPILESNDDVK